MRGLEWPAHLVASRDAYRARRHATRRAFLLGWLVLLGVWAVSLAGVLVGVDPDSADGGLAHGLSFLLPIALVIGLPAWYVHLRRKNRVDDYEETHESDDPDPYPTDRLVHPVRPWQMLVIALLPLSVLLGLPWMWAAVEPGAAPAVVVWTVVVVALVAVAAVRGRRVGVSASPDALIVTTLSRRYAVPWGEVHAFTVDVVETPAPRGGTYRQLRLGVQAGGSVPRDAGCALSLGTRGQRARARHNLRTAIAWSREHGLPVRVDLAAGGRWADGDISADELMVRAGTRSGW